MSAYRNKLAMPLNISLKDSDFKEKIKYSILKKYRWDKLAEWKKTKDSSKLTVDFPTYIRWIVDTPNIELNDHFCPVVLLAQPCRVQYDFYANFNRISSDVHMVMKKFNIPDEYYRDVSYYGQSGHNTSTILPDYYSTLSASLKTELFKDFYTELDFYYHLYPEEKDSHVKLLGVKDSMTFTSATF